MCYLLELCGYLILLVFFVMLDVIVWDSNMGVCVRNMDLRIYLGFGIY